MGAVVSAVKSGFGRQVTGEQAAKQAGNAAAEQAQGIMAGTQIQVDAQSEALNYLKEREAMPQQFREGALGQIGGLYGLGSVSGEESLANLRNTPMYNAIMSQQGAGEDAIMRNQAMTGGLRSGNTQNALARYSGDLQNQALMQSLSGLQGLASLPSNAGQIASGISGIGQTMGSGVMGQAQTYAQGTVANAQAKQQGALGLLELGVGAGTAFASDPALKTDVKLIGEVNGHNIYSWVWNKAAEAIGLKGSGKGVMANEVKQANPSAVIMQDGYMAVYYDMIGVK
jgi:hypothetical protein